MFRPLERYRDERGLDVFCLVRYPRMCDLPELVFEYCCQHLTFRFGLMRNEAIEQRVQSIERPVFMVHHVITPVGWLLVDHYIRAQMYVDEAFRRQGHASRMFRAALSEFNDLGAHYHNPWVDEVVGKARRLREAA